MRMDAPVSRLRPILMVSIHVYSQAFIKARCYHCCCQIWWPGSAQQAGLAIKPFARVVVRGRHRPPGVVHRAIRAIMLQRDDLARAVAA
jgi:hypothetical protein